MAVEEKDDLKLFTLSKVASTSELSFSVFNSAPGREQLALVLQCGDLLFFNLTSTNVSDAIRYIPWFEGSKKRIEAATFDPLFGLWLLVACCDGSLHVVPSLLPLKITNSLDGLDSDWSLDDVTLLPPICDNGMLDIVPTAIAWWDRIESEGRCRNVAIIGGSNGEILLADMVSGAVLGRTNVEGRVMTIEICKDDDVIDLSPVFLLITNDVRQQWKLVLEDHENNYSWPFPHQPSRASSRASLISGAGSEESVSRPSLTSFPLTRARLQGLKQLSVEKLATLRQKLSETRNRGLNVTLKRRGSSSSEESLTKQLRSSAVSSDNESTIKLSNDGGPKLISLKDSFLSLQVERNRRVITAHYPPSQLFTVYNVSINPSPGFVHKLSPTSHNILLTNWLLYIADTNNKCLSVVSNRLSQCRIDSQKQFLNSDFNPDTVLQEFLFLEEEILYLYRLTPLLQENEIGKENEASQHAQLNKANASSHNDRFPINGCIVVTNKNIYKVTTRKEPDEIVLNCVLDPKKLEKAERLCMIFGLNLQQLIEAAATRQLERGQLTSALYLYKMARCRPVKSLLRMASAGYTEQLLYLTHNQQTNILQTSQLSQSEALHLSNLCVLTLTEQYLRQKTTGKLTPNFKWFLKENHHYDEVFAVGVIGQSGICSILNFLCDERGLATQVLDVLCTIIRQQHSPKLDFDLCDGFWDCMTNEKLCQSLVTNPDIAKAHLRFLENRMTSVDENTLQRLAKLYDPSQPSVRPALQRLMLDYLDNESIYSVNSKSRQEDDQFLLSDWLAGYFVTCFYLNLVRRKYENCYYEADLQLESEHNSTQHTVQSKGHLAVSCNTISAGNTHVALVRNGRVYVWGHAAYGCLGIGPIISQSVMPTQVPFFYVLGIQVLSVACGKAHTLALTDNGLYSWGSSIYGQLGIGVTSQSSEPRLIERLYNERVTSVMAGQYHSLALTMEGWLYTWGWGVHGQLGHNSVEDCHYPCRVEALLAEVCVACSGGHAHTIVLTSTGRVWAFGSSVFGQLGTGSNAKSNHPVQVFGLPEKITAISTAYFHNLALAASNRLYTWGSSPQVLRLQAQAQKKARVQYQQQQQSMVKERKEENFDNTQESLNVELPQGFPSNKEESSDSESDPSKRKAQMKLLQANRFSSTNSEIVMSPSTEFKGLPTGKAVTEQISSTFTSESKCPPPLPGVDDGLSHLSPTLVDTSHVEGKIAQISCGCHHSALLTENGQVYTWGRNLDAQLGNGARVKEALYPSHITVGNNVELQTVVCGCDFTIGLEAGGRAWGWGSNQQAQLGRLQVEDPSRAGVEGCLFMLKSSKRVIKLPHSSANTVDTPKEIPSLPVVQIEFSTQKPNLEKLKSLKNLSLMENPPHNYSTLYYALSFFHGYYNLSKMQEKCIELNDYITAAKLASLDKQYDVAMGYQLKAAMVKNECFKTLIKCSISNNKICNEKDNMPLVRVKSNEAVVTTDVFVPTLETSLIVNSEAGIKIGIKRACSNSDKTKANIKDDAQSININVNENEPSENSLEKISKGEDCSERSNSEMHTFAEQGGAEEMSTRSQDTLRSENNRSDDVFDSRSETPDTLASSCCDEFCTKSADIFDSPVKTLNTKETMQNHKNNSLVHENAINPINNVDQNGHDELVEDLANIVEFYMALCESGSKSSLNALLKQGLEFWTNHNLPVCRLEELLLSHWSLVAYPLGVILLGSEQACFDSEQVLSHLSTDFSIQLCSAMVQYTSNKENSCPEMVEVLSGLSWPDQTSARLSGHSSQVNIEQVISQINSAQQSQPYIDIDITSDLSKDLTSNEEVISFTCGHRYSSFSSLNIDAKKAVRTLDDKSLTNTGQVLQDLFQQPFVVQHCSCPTCVLECIQSEIE